MEKKNKSRLNSLNRNPQNWLHLYDVTKKVDRINEKLMRKPKGSSMNFGGTRSSPITEFDENLRNTGWFTQFHNGCLFFAMMNGGFIPSQWKVYFTPKMDFSQRMPSRRTMLQTIKGVSHEYKAILMWHLMTSHNVVPGKLQLISQKIKDMLKQSDFQKMYDIARDINELYASEELFGIRHEDGKEKDFAYGHWTFNNYKAHPLKDTKDKNQLDLKLSFLERCPRYSLFCDRLNHWMTFLGCKESYMVFYDSLKPSDVKIIQKTDVARNTISVLPQERR